MSSPKILVVGSANADIFITADPSLPQVGETVGGALTKVGPGGKGSNQAAASHLGSEHLDNVQLITAIGQDEHAKMFLRAYEEIQLTATPFQSTTPTGQAYILLEKKSSNNSIIVCPGANMVFPQPLQLNNPSEITKECILNRLTGDLEHIKTTLLSIRALLLQREIPDNVNLFFAYTCQHINQYYNFTTQQCQCCDDNVVTSNQDNHRIFTMLDVGGIGDKVDVELLPYIDLISFNETEMARVYAQAHSYLPSTFKSDNTIVNNLLRLDTIVDEVSGSIYLLHENCSENNTKINILDNYSIFSPSSSSSSTAVTPSITTIDLTKDTSIVVPFDLSPFVHAGNAINAMARTTTTSQKSIKVLITLGQHGSLLLSQNTLHSYQSPIKLNPEQVVDSTGCGDAYRGCLCTSFVETVLKMEETEVVSHDDNKIWSQAMRFATAGASVCLGTLGTLPAMGKRSQILTMLEHVPQ